MKKTSMASPTKRQLIDKSNATIILTLAVTAFVVAFSLVFLNFLWDLSNHNRRVISGKSEASNILKSNTLIIPDLQSNFTVLEAGDVKSDQILDALPSKYDFPALATSMESLVERSGLTLKAFSGDDQEDSAIQSETEPSPIEIEFSVDVEGSYVNVKKFVDSLERTTRPIKVKNIEMKGTDTTMRASIRAITYYQPATSLDVETRTVE